MKILKFSIIMTVEMCFEQTRERERALSIHSEKLNNCNLIFMTEIVDVKEK